MLHKTLKFNTVSQDFFYSLNVKILANYFPCLYKTVPYKTVQYKIVRKVWKWTKKQSEKHSQIIIALTSRPLFNKHKEQNSDRRSRTNVLRACKQRAGLNTKLRAGYRREAATWNWTVLCWTVFFLLYFIVFGLFCIGLFCICNLFTIFRNAEYFWIVTISTFASVVRNFVY